MRTLLVGVLVSAVLLPMRTAPAAAITLPAGFQEQIVFTGLSQPTNIEFAPDGRVFVAEKGGRVKVFDGLADTSSTVFADLSAQVHNQWDRGLLGLALAPNFPVDPWVYVLYTYDAPPGQTAPVWNDVCPSANGGDCLVTARLSRLQADGNVMTGSEQLLVADWCQQFPSHSIGDLKFGADGALYVSGGDGASFNATDYGQFGNPKNPCGDPPGGVGSTLAPPTAEGGALRSQDVRTTADPTSLGGTILRLNPATGAAMAGNPLIGSADLNARRIVAHGLRNPFRFTIRPGTSEVWVSDVGWNTWEEVNRAVNPTAGVTNFGWPCYEGPNRMGSYDSADLALCESLYSGAGQTAPYYSYNHSAKVVTGEVCPSGGSSVAGSAFYPTGGGPYPSQYAGALFFSDYSRNCIWAMKPTTAGGLPSATNIETFGSTASSPVDLAMGPGGELYYADLGGSVRRIRYFPGNQPPNAVISPSTTSGNAPLTVNFSATASTDPDPADQGRLTYQWDFTNDGTVDSTAATTSFTYTTAGTYTARLVVTDTLGVTDTDTVVITPGNSAPTATIDTPAASLTWQVGDTVAFTGSATDPQQGTLPASALSWELRMQHCYSAGNCHTHFLQDWTGVASGSFAAPDHEYPSYLELVLTARDAQGLTSTALRRLDPKTVDLTFTTNPPGLQVSVGATNGTTPFTRTVIQGSANSVSAPTPQVVGATTYAFSSWSDGAAQTHVVTAPTGATTYTATYSGTTATTCGTDSFGHACTEGNRSFVPANQTVLGISGDEGSQQVSLPFPMRFYGTNYSAAWIDANGVLSFQAVSEAWNSGPIPSAPAANTANLAAYPLWSDLWIDETASVRTATVGTAPNRQFVVEWRNASFYSNRSAHVTFEVILDESGIVTFAYKDIDAAAIEQGSTSTVGIENAAGTVALQYSHNQPTVRTGRSLTFVPPGVTPPPAPGTVTGTVTTDTGTPVGGATVSVVGAGLTTTASADGTYTITGVPAGPHTISGSLANGCSRYSGSAPATVGSGGTVAVNFSLSTTPVSDSFGYTCTEGSRAFVAADQTILAISGDEGTRQVTLPFPVRFYGANYTTAWVDANGLLSFQTTSNAWKHGPIPSAVAPNQANLAVYALWEDLFLDASASVRTATLGTGPNRQFVVEWRNVTFYDDRTARVTFEIIFDEAGGITLVYKDLAATSIEQGGSATVGIENATGTVAFQYSLNQPVLRNTKSITFIAPP